MDGRSLYSRIVESVQEMSITIGDVMGSASFYYPFDGDLDALRKEFSDASGGEFPGIALEKVPGRLRATVSEEDCRRIAAMPVKSTMEDVLLLVKGGASMEGIREAILPRHPGSRIGRTGGMEFDWALSFPEGDDDNVYCFSEEMGRVTCHRFSREEYLAFGFELP